VLGPPRYLGGYITPTARYKKSRPGIASQPRRENNLVRD
jgi:hypothetical protein